MKRLLWGMILLCLALAASAPAALAAGNRVRVTPATGGIHTHFVLRFSIPDFTGRIGSVSVADAVSVIGNGHPGCLDQADVPLRFAPAGTAFRLTLNPSHLGGHWCTGRFSGLLLERRTTICRPRPALIVCPLYVIAPRVLARFHFTVRPPERAHTAR